MGRRLVVKFIASLLLMGVAIPIKEILMSWQAVSDTRLVVNVNLTATFDFKQAFTEISGETRSYASYRLRAEAADPYIEVRDLRPQVNQAYLEAQTRVGMQAFTGEPLPYADGVRADELVNHHAWHSPEVTAALRSLALVEIFTDTELPIYKIELLEATKEDPDGALYFDPRRGQVVCEGEIPFRDEGNGTLLLTSRSKSAFVKRMVVYEGRSHVEYVLLTDKVERQLLMATDVPPDLEMKLLSGIMPQLSIA